MFRYTFLRKRRCFDNLEINKETCFLNTDEIYQVKRNCFYFLKNWVFKNNFLKHPSLQEYKKFIKDLKILMNILNKHKILL